MAEELRELIVDMQAWVEEHLDECFENQGG